MKKTLLLIPIIMFGVAACDPPPPEVVADITSDQPTSDATMVWFCHLVNDNAALFASIVGDPADVGC